jgi:hypothetical protein
VRLAAFAVVLAATPAIAEEYSAPPHQQDAWTAPKTSLDAKVVAAAAKLFDSGLADPRGCEYRAIELDVGEPWSGGATALKTHGWVLPKTHFAIAWNGLVYQTRSIGDAADVAADARAMLAADAAARAQAERDNPGSGFHRFPRAHEAFSVATESMSPLKSILLLRLGHGDLAAKIWTASADSVADPLAALAHDWLWTAYERGITAHMRGDVALAIESWRRLPALAPLIETKDRGRDFLRDLDAVLADERRRAAHPSPPIDLTAIAALPQAARIAKLIGALDQVAARQWGQPGGVALGEDPIIQALVKEGEPAIEPLIAAFETDERRTRSVQFWRDFARHREVLAVYEAAYVALAGVLDMSFFTPVSTGDNLTARGPAGRKQLAAELRAYWKQWKGVSNEERAYRMLADDKLAADKWLAAAAQITQPTNVQRIPSSSIGQYTVTTPLPNGQAPKLRGEALRGKASPTVTELFGKRLPAFTDLRQRAAWLEMYATWDPKVAKPHLAKTARDAFAAWSKAPHNGMQAYEGAALAELTSVRASLGDGDALADYAAWIVTTSPSDADFEARAWLRPMMDNPSVPEIARAADKLFGKSPWVPLVTKQAGYHLIELLATDLIHVAAFKKHVLAQLANHGKLGTVRMRRGDIEVETPAFQQSEGIDDKDPLRPPEGTVYVLRVADQYAASLGARDGAPKFRRYWPEATRDRAIEEIAAWLRKQ